MVEVGDVVQWQWHGEGEVWTSTVLDVLQEDDGARVYKVTAPEVWKQRGIHTPDYLIWGYEVVGNACQQ